MEMVAVSTATYYQLKCMDCGEVFRPLVATEPGELSAPVDFENYTTAGITNLESLKNFQDTHRNHHLLEVEVHGEFLGVN